MNAVAERRRFPLAATSAAIVLLACSAASAAEERARESSRPASARVESTRAIAAQAPNARLAVLVDAGGRVVRSKGVRSVQRLRVGEYCIRPTGRSGVNPRTAVLTTSPEFFFSLLSEIKVQWVTFGSECGADRIGIYTLADTNDDGVYGFSNDVAFSVVVP